MRSPSSGLDSGYPTCMDVFFSGRVQGVGFRYTVLHLAQDLAITGFVRNCLDRRVHLRIEGRSYDQAELLRRIQSSRLAHGIVDQSAAISKAWGRYESFLIEMDE